MKEKNKKGFTLIELLAVIVILAIIALIATPIIIGIVERSRMNSFENSVYGIMEAYQLRIAGEENVTGIVYNLPADYNEFKYTGTKMTGGSVFVSSSKEIEVEKMTDGVYCANGTKENLTVQKGNCE